MILVTPPASTCKLDPLRFPLLGQRWSEGLFNVYHGADCNSRVVFDNFSPDPPIVTIGYAPRPRGWM